jgi:hypothetical protein
MLKAKLLFFSLTILANFCVAQKDVQKALEMGKKYPKSDVYITQNNIDFYLEYNKPDKTVIAIQKEKTSLISLNSNVSHVFTKNYHINSSYIEYARFESEYNYNCKIYNSDYSSNNIFHHDEKLKVIELFFKQRGDYLSFVSKKRFLDLKYIEPIYLANLRPTEEKTIKLSIENELEFEILELNFENFDIEKKYEFDEKKNLHKYEFKIKNPPYIADIDDVRGTSFHLPHILILPKSYKSKKHNQEYFKDTKDLYKWYSSLVDSVKDDDDQLKPFLKTLISDNDTDIEKIKKIYYWVQQNIRYIAFEDGIAGFKPEAAHNVFNKKYGDCKGVANLTKHLLNLEGFDARLTWIGTNSRAYDYSIPSLYVDNHMICALFYKDEIYYLDGTERFMPLGHNAERIQNKEALIEDGENFIIKKVPTQKANENVRTRTTNMVIEGNTMLGKSIMNYAGESRSNIKAYLNSIENDKKAKALRDYYDSDNIEIQNINYSKIQNFDSLFSINFDFVSNNSAISFDDELYLKFENYPDFKHSEIDTSFLFDYDLHYKKEIRSRTSIDIPSNYTVTFLPESIKYVNSDFNLEINFEIINNQIIYNKTINIPNGLIHQTNKEEWNKALKELIEVYNSNIILKKS